PDTVMPTVVPSAAFSPTVSEFASLSLGADGARLLTIIEIGSGNSTKFFAKAKRDFNLGTRIVSIDPHPRAEIRSLTDEALEKTVLDFAPEFFKSLQPGDFLFFD